MRARQYIGARYVLKIYENSQDPQSAEWEANTSYEPLTMVNYNSSSYISRAEVPANIGNPVDNPTYWALSGLYNGQIANLENRIREAEGDIDDIEAAISDAGLTATLNRIMNDIPVNTWYPDNGMAANSITPSGLSFTEISAQCMNFDVEMKVEKWTPFTNNTKELALRTVATNQNSNIQWIRNGWHVTASSGVCQIQTSGCVHVADNQCVKFKVNGNKGNTQYCRTGLYLHGVAFIYYNNAENRICYECAGNSWTPTAINSTVFNADVIEIYCFINQASCAIYAKADHGALIYLGTFTNTVALTGPVGVFVRMQANISAVAEIWDMETVYTFSAMSDTKYIHYDDTTPFVVDGKAYMTADLQADNCNFTGILRHTLGFNDLELVGVITNNISSYSTAPDCCFNRKAKEFIFMFRASQDSTTKISYAISHTNSLDGIIDLNVTLLPPTDTEQGFGNYIMDEDPAICLFNGKWYIAINRIVDNEYYYNIYATPDDTFDIDSFEFVSQIKSTSLTGGCFLAIGDVLYLISGDGSTINTFNAITGSSTGTLNVTAAYRVWGNLTGISKGNKTKFYLTTFDRNTYGSSAWSYGAVHMFESTDNLSELIFPNTYGV